MELYQRITYPIVDVYKRRGQLVELELTSGVEDTVPVLEEMCIQQGWIKANGVDSSAAARATS